jgi:tRNA A58 N-methylase Trm61
VSRQSLKVYAERARLISDPLQASARLEFMRLSEKLIIPKDLLQKLEITPTDRVLDIGAGVGNISIPLSFFVAEYTVVDHPDVLSRMKTRLPE